MNDRRGLGDFGERLAARWLQRAGYEILATNVAVRPWGEIDIVARSGEYLALVEVRTRRGDRFGGAALSITPRKRRRMLNAAAAYLASREEGTLSPRIDVVLIELDRRGRVEGLQHIENAVELEAAEIDIG